MSVPEAVGLAIVAVGLLMMVVGVFATLREARRAGLLGQASDFVDRLAKLVAALAGSRPSVVLFTFGTLLVFLGSAVLGANDLAN